MASTDLAPTQQKTTSRPAVQTASQELRVVADELSARMQTLLQKNKARWLVIKQGGDHILLQIPLLAGLIAGAAFILLMSSKRAVLLAVAALFAHIHITIADEVEEVEEPAPVTMRPARRSRQK